MPTFYFVATNKKGQIAKGTLQADDKITAVGMLQTAGFSQIDVSTDGLEDRERPPTKGANPYAILSSAIGLTGLGFVLWMKPWAMHATDRRFMVLLAFLSFSFVFAFIGFFSRHSYRSLNWLATLVLILCALIFFSGLGWFVFLSIQELLSSG